MKRIETKNWACPTNCGCIVEVTTAWGLPIEEIDTLVDTHLLKIGVSTNTFSVPEHFEAFKNTIREDTIKGMQDRNVKVAPTRIISQCVNHANLTTPQELHDEIYHFHGIGYTPITQCGCSLYHILDDRATDAPLAPAEHIYNVKKCDVHKDIEDVTEHFNTVHREAFLVTKAINQVATDLNIEADTISFSFDANRKVVIDHIKLEVSKQTIDASVAKIYG